MASVKRRAEISLDNAPKKTKGAVSPFHTRFKRSAAEVLASKGKELNAFMCLRVAMVWRHDPDTKEFKRRVCFEDMSAKGKHPRQFEVLFTGKCILLWDHLGLTINDELLLSMRGSSFTCIPLGSFNVTKLPFQLTYDDGCIVKFIQRIGRGKTNQTVVNLWNIKDSPLLDMDVDNTKDVMILGPSSSQGFRQHIDNMVPNNDPGIEIRPPADPQYASQIYVTNEDAHSPRQIPLQNEITEGQEPTIALVKESGRQRRKRQHMEIVAQKKRDRAARQQREQGTAHIDEANPQMVSLDNPANIAESVSHDIGMQPDVSSGSHDVSLAECDQSVPIPVEQPVTPVHDSNEVVESLPEGDQHHIATSDVEFPGLDLAAGWPGYRPLSYVVLQEAVGLEHSVIGIVTGSRSINRTSKGEWSQSINLIDPSNFSASEAARFRTGVGFTINLFTKKYPGWLPSPKEGDVLILKKVKPTKNRGPILGTVYYDKLKWAIYNPVTSLLHHGDRGDAPWSEGLNEGAGAILSPFYVPPSSQGELFYCQKLGEWWQAMLAKREKDLGVVYQVESSKRNHRIHRLISETNQDCEPGGYFDCTVQFLQGYQNENEVYSIFVTDYTSNPGLPKNDRYGERLQDMILKIEMWDEAAKIGPTMVPNGFYSLNNCRMMIKGFDLQGKIVENRIQRLDEEDKEREALARLLERKEAIGSGTHDKPRPLWNIQEAEPERFFDCSVELLHKVNEEGETYIFVTDYTPNDKFLGTASDQPWSEGLDGRVLKIKIFGDVNTKKVQGMPVGGFYRLVKVRFWDFSRTWVCHLKEQGSISKMNAKSATDDHLKDLLRRRKEWKNSRGDSIDLSMLDSASNSSTAPLAQPGPTDFPHIKSHPCKFDAVARIVDFYPLRLENCLVLQCEKCHKELRGLLKTCPDCNEATMENAALLYQCFLFVVLRDRIGKEIVASACDPDCSLMKDLDCNSEEDYIESLETRLKPVLGNLVEVHNSLEQGEEIEPNTAEMKFTIVSWVDAGDKERYGLLDVVAL